MFPVSDICIVSRLKNNSANFFDENQRVDSIKAPVETIFSEYTV